MYCFTYRAVGFNLVQTDCSMVVQFANSCAGSVTLVLTASDCDLAVDHRPQSTLCLCTKGSSWPTGRCSSLTHLSGLASSAFNSVCAFSRKALTENMSHG